MILIVAGFLLYQQALDSPTWRRFLLAGVALGRRRRALNRPGPAYVVVAVLLCWLITGRPHRGHFVLLGGAVMVITAYLLLM